MVGFYCAAILSGAEIMPGRGICRNYARFSTCRYNVEISTRPRKNSYIRKQQYSANLESPKLENAKLAKSKLENAKLGNANITYCAASLCQMTAAAPGTLDKEHALI